MSLSREAVCVREIEGSVEILRLEDGAVSQRIKVRSSPSVAVLATEEATLVEDEFVLLVAEVDGWVEVFDLSDCGGDEPVTAVAEFEPRVGIIAAVYGGKTPARSQLNVTCMTVFLYESPGEEPSGVLVTGTSGGKLCAFSLADDFEHWGCHATALAHHHHPAGRPVIAVVAIRDAASHNLAPGAPRPVIVASAARGDHCVLAQVFRPGLPCADHRFGGRGSASSVVALHAADGGVVAVLKADRSARLFQIGCEPLMSYPLVVVVRAPPTCLNATVQLWLDAPAVFLEPPNERFPINVCPFPLTRRTWPVQRGPWLPACCRTAPAPSPPAATMALCTSGS